MTDFTGKLSEADVDTIKAFILATTDALHPKPTAPATVSGTGPTARP
jgi:hypothetical protein